MQMKESNTYKTQTHKSGNAKGGEESLKVEEMMGYPCKTRENFKFQFFKKQKGKMVIYRNSPEKSWDFSRSRMMKRIAPLESSREI